MKQIRHIAIIATAVAAVSTAACTKEIDSPELGEGTEMTITASFAENQTKTTLQDGGTAVYWEAEDEVKLFYDGIGSKFTSNCTEPARISKFTGSMNVMFGFDEGFSDSTPLWGLYPFRSDATADNVSVTTTLPSEQTGKAGSFAKGMNLSLAKSTSLSMGFYNVCGGIRFSVTRDDVKNVVFEALNSESIAGKVKLEFEGGVPVIQEVVDSESAITLTAPAGGVFETGKWYYIVALPGTLNGGFKMTFNTKTKYAVLESTGSKTIRRGTFGSLADADEDLVYKDKTTPEPEKGSYVDLGLSVNWATCNIGASKPEEYGTYFAWGDVVGQTWNGSEWSGGGFSTYPSYELDENNNLKPEYDAAHVNLGGNWRMPTEAEQQELINNCSSTWTSDYNGTGVAGRIFTSKKEGYTDKSIFLPAAGYGRSSRLDDAGSIGFYWSSTFAYDIPWNLGFNLDCVITTMSDLYQGFSIRPVIESIPVTGVSLNQSSISIDKGSTYNLTATITPENATNKSVTWSSSDESVATVSSDGAVTAIASGHATITVTTADGGKTASCTVTVNDPEVVDLGLSVKWRSWNVGATKPEEYGRYFAWGDVVGQTWNGSEWSGGGFSTYPSYELDENNNLKPEYDAAHVNLGGNWRMPTWAEQQELIDNCTSTWTSDYNGTGVAGRIFTSNKEGYTDKSIFLPAAGRGNRGELLNADSYGFYWSRTFRSNDDAWILYFCSDYIYTGYFTRSHGKPVRPVTE